MILAVSVLDPTTLEVIVGLVILAGFLFGVYSRRQRRRSQGRFESNDGATSPPSPEGGLRRAEGQVTKGRGLDERIRHSRQGRSGERYVEAALERYKRNPEFTVAPDIALELDGRPIGNLDFFVRHEPSRIAFAIEVKTTSPWNVDQARRDRRQVARACAAVRQMENETCAPLPVVAYVDKSADVRRSIEEDGRESWARKPAYEHCAEQVYAERVWSVGAARLPDLIDAAVGR